MTYLEAAEFLKKHDRYLLLTHIRPDGDTIGSAVALCEMLRCIGKTAWLLPSLDITSLLEPYLDGYVAGESFVPETVISVDVASRDLLPQNAEKYADHVKFCIDHHPSNTFYAEETCLEAEKAACGEIIWKICKLFNVMNPAIAVPLYVAISTDTGCFVYSNTTPNSHRVAAELMEMDVPYQALNKIHFRTKSMARLQLESMLMQSVKLFYDGTVAMATVSLSMMKEAGATEDDAEDIASLIGQIKGVLHSITIRELHEKECKISLRTNPEYLDAAATCARLGGGGHAAASGCTVYGDIQETETAIMDAVRAQLAEQQQI